MEIWLDTANLQVVQRANQLGVLRGVTTNPTIVAHSQLPLEELLLALLSAQKGPVMAQVIASSADQMMKQGESLVAISDRIFVAIPVTREGLRAICGLSQKKISVMATAVFDPNQAILASQAGASYIVPYFSHICEADQDGVNVLRSISETKSTYKYATKIVASSLTTTEQIRECCLMGVDGVSLTEELFNEYVGDHPMTVKIMRRFERDWKQAAHSKLF